MEFIELEETKLDDSVKTVNMSVEFVFICDCL